MRAMSYPPYLKLLTGRAVSAAAGSECAFTCEVFDRDRPSIPRALGSTGRYTLLPDPLSPDLSQVDNRWMNAQRRLHALRTMTWTSQDADTTGDRISKWNDGVAVSPHHQGSPDTSWSFLMLRIDAISPHTSCTSDSQVRRIRQPGVLRTLFQDKGIAGSPQQKIGQGIWASVEIKQGGLYTRVSVSSLLGLCIVLCGH
jgi:hypothetical protein